MNKNMGKDDTDAVWKRAEIASPCVKLCGIHPRAKICTGCFRTMEEITQWGRYTHEERAELMAELPERQSLLKQRRGGRRTRRA